MSAWLRHALHRRVQPQRYQFLESLLANQALSRNALADKQRRDLADMVAFAAGNTAYYRNRYAGIPLAVDSFDITRLPILTKEEVLAHREALLADGLPEGSVRLGYTGGSTGKPLGFYYDSTKTELMRAGMSRSYMWVGWRPGQKIVNFWGAKQDLKGGAWLRRTYRDFIKAEHTIGAWEYSEADLAAWVRKINRYRPVLLQGYASILAELAGYVVEQGLRIRAPLLGVFSTAEVLHARQRALMEQAFSCRVFNQYGSREVPNIACECRHGNLHVLADMVYLESMTIDGEDRLLVTSLTNRVMPLIRYEIGDSGRLKPGECGCGSPFPMLEMGLCRSNDIIRLADGRRIYPSYFVHLLDGLSGIRQYQFIQTAADRIMLSVVADPMPSPEIWEPIRKQLSREFSQALTFEVHQVDAIPRSQSGKHRFVISQLEH